MIGGNLVALLACACLLTARAQYRFDHWTMDNGLPANGVYALLRLSLDDHGGWAGAL